MIAAGLTTPEVLDELEGHLRDDVERRIRTGMIPEEAFEGAALSIGPAAAVNNEFAKGNPMKSVIGNRSAAFTLSLTGLAYFWIVLMGGYALLHNDMSLTQRLSGFGAIALAGLSIGRGRWSHRFLPVISDKRTRKIICWTCVILALAWLPIFGCAVLPNAALTMGQILVTTLWSLALPPAILGLSEGMEEAARRRAMA